MVAFQIQAAVFLRSNFFCDILKPFYRNVRKLPAKSHLGKLHFMNPRTAKPLEVLLAKHVSIKN